MTTDPRCKHHHRTLQRASSRARWLSTRNFIRLRPELCSKCQGWRLVVVRSASSPAPAEPLP